MIKPENRKAVTKYFSPSVLAKTELWLREEAKNGWRLDDVEEYVFFNKYYFIKSKNCDEVYLGTVAFDSREKNLSNTESSIKSYLKFKYHLKPLNNRQWCFWYKMKKEQITDIKDVKTNLLIREKCISRYYNKYLWVTGIASVLSLYFPFVSGIHNIFFPILFSVLFVIFLIKKLNHKRTCKIAYKNFLED